MAITYQPEQLPKLIDKTEQTLAQMEAMNHPQKHDGVSFFKASYDTQIKLAEDQLNQIQQHIQRLDHLQDQYFSAALSHLAVGYEHDQAIYFDELQVMKGRLEANQVSIQKMLTQKDHDEPNTIRLLANRLTENKKSLTQINRHLDTFIKQHSDASVNNAHRIDQLRHRAQKLQALLPKDSSSMISIPMRP